MKCECPYPKIERGQPSPTCMTCNREIEWTDKEGLIILEHVKKDDNRYKTYIEEIKNPR